MDIMATAPRSTRRKLGLLPRYNGATAVRDEGGDIHCVYPDGKWFKAPRRQTKGPAYYAAQKAEVK